MNKNDLPARRFTGFFFFFWLYCVTTVTPFIERSIRGVTVVTLRYLKRFADLSNIFFIQSLLFSTAALTRHGRVHASPMVCKLLYTRSPIGKGLTARACMGDGGSI